MKSWSLERKTNKLGLNTNDARYPVFSSVLITLLLKFLLLATQGVACSAFLVALGFAPLSIIPVIMVMVGLPTFMWTQGQDKLAYGAPAALVGVMNETNRRLAPLERHL